MRPRRLHLHACHHKSFLTAPSPFLMSGGGTPLPNERLLSGRVDHDDRDARPCGRPCRISPPAPAPSAPAGPSKPSKTHFSAARTAPKAARRSSSAPSKRRARCSKCRPTFCIGIVPASDTGAVEMAMWSMLGARPVTMIAWESFGEGWVTDVAKQLKLKDVTRASRRPTASCPICPRSIPSPTSCSPGTARPRACACRTPTGSRRTAKGITICDATSAAFAQPLDWAKLDVVTFSWQKALGGEAAHGMLILSPRAVARLESYTPPWPLPKIFRMTKGGKVNRGIFEGETINTPSMLCVEDYLDTLAWAKSAGGLKGLRARADANAKVIHDWVAQDAVDREPRRGSGDALEHVGVPEDRRSGDHVALGRCAMGLRQGPRRADREGGRGLRHRDAPRRAAGPAHLVRLHGRALRSSRR